MTTTTAIERISPRDNGRNVVWYRFTRTETSVEWIHGPVRLGSGADIQAFGESIAANVETYQLDVERKLWWMYFAVKGIDLDTIPAPSFDTLNNMRRWLIKELFNKMRSDIPDQGKAQMADTVWDYLAKFTDLQISNLINRPAWTEAKVTSTRAKLSDIRDAYLLLDHGEGEID